MSIPVVSSDAAAMAAVLLDTAALIEEADAAGLAVTCYCDRARILVTSSAGGAARPCGPGRRARRAGRRGTVPAVRYCRGSGRRRGWKPPGGPAAP